MGVKTNQKNTRKHPDYIKWQTQITVHWWNEIDSVSSAPTGTAPQHTRKPSSTTTTAALVPSRKENKGTKRPAASFSPLPGILSSEAFPVPPPVLLWHLGALGRSFKLLRDLLELRTHDQTFSGSGKHALGLLKIFPCVPIYHPVHLFLLVIVFNLYVTILKRWSRTPWKGQLSSQTLWAGHVSSLGPSLFLSQSEGLSRWWLVFLESRTRDLRILLRPHTDDILKPLESYPHDLRTPLCLESHTSDL